MNTHRVQLFSLVFIASAVCAVTTYFHFVYWADIVAGFSNYFVSMFVVPMASALLVGYVCTLMYPISNKSKLLIAFTPAACTFILVLFTYSVLQWGHH